MLIDVRAVEPAASGATPHARATYLADAARHGTALCLSGGGFRASLFHLGAVRRLYELGLMHQVRTIAAVSGGSMIAAYLAARRDIWRAPGPLLGAGEWDRRVAAPFRAFASRNLGTWPVLVGWMPWNWANNAGVEALAEACEDRDLTKQTTADLPSDPQFLFEASNLVNGQSWSFRRTNRKQSRRVSTAVAVSSCYPVFFRPYTETAPERIALMDGGLDDNRGIEPVWRTHEYLLVSDGGEVLQPQWGESLVWSLMRSATVVWNRSQQFQKRWVISNFIARQLAGAYWGIDSSPMHYLDRPGRETFTGYTPALARDTIATIRTSYDAFSAAEAAVLENHGYFLAEAATRAHLVWLRPSTVPPLMVPHPAWMNEASVRAALRNSAKNKFFGRF